MSESSISHKTSYAKVTVNAHHEDEVSMGNQSTCPIDIIFSNVTFKADKGKFLVVLGLQLPSLRQYM